ncbi:hypothetical protein GRO01_10960 [Gluconobacter roseus NBRC 3990]|uniref:Uncharacterized protein n=1 Tax=Gluconobacter roseus NBRC 3990 TaxID=1307950 RepID=A0A4Y3M2J7_9PROT|nr:tetratricopeptide repeat protein [Gluconobacter roseus]GEB03520.1 hypothetical protein GRO01_10960 [Gluconobacter roseus NBRC 3990]
MRVSFPSHAVVLAFTLTVPLAGCVSNASHNAQDVARERQAARNPETMMKVGDSARARGDWTTSAAFYGRAVALRPGQPDYVGPYAEALMHQGRTNEAIEAIHGAEANATSAERVRLALLLAQLLNTAQRSQEAIGVLLPVIQQNPNSAPLRVALGISYEISGDAQGARQSYRDALRIDPANIAAANDLALSEALGGGQPQQARTELLALRTQAVERGASAASLSTIDGNLAIVYALEGKLSDARQSARSAALSSEQIQQNMRFYTLLHAAQGVDAASSATGD